MKDMVKEYYELKQQEKEIQSRMLELNKEIKDMMMKNLRTDKYIIEGYSLRLAYVDMRKFTDDIIPYLKNNGFGHLVETKEVFDYEEVKKLIKKKEININEVNKFKGEKGKRTVNLYVRKI